MNRFGEIADELTDLIEEMERSDIAADGKALKLVLERAFAKACEAERALRLRQEAEPKAVRLRRRAGARVEVEAPPATGVVIELPPNWRGGAARLRRLMD
jgi:hypothetical protein